MARSKLIIFDCDGVIVDSEPLAALAYEQVYAKHGMDGVNADVIAQCIGMKQSDIIIKINALTGHQLTLEAAGDIWTETKRLFTERLQPTRGIVAFLDRLSFDRCVASSSSVERIHHSLEVTRLASFFGAAIFSSSMVRNGKPAPDIFLFAADRMKADPADCIVIEDSPLGVQGAVAAGMTAIGYVGGSHSYPDHGKKLAGAGAEIICQDWQGIADEISGLTVPG